MEYHSYSHSAAANNSQYQNYYKSSNIIIEEEQPLNSVQEAVDAIKNRVQGDARYELAENLFDNNVPDRNYACLAEKLKDREVTPLNFGEELKKLGVKTNDLRHVDYQQLEKAINHRKEQAEANQRINFIHNAIDECVVKLTTIDKNTPQYSAALKELQTLQKQHELTDDDLKAHLNAILEHQSEPVRSIMEELKNKNMRDIREDPRYEDIARAAQDVNTDNNTPKEHKINEFAQAIKNAGLTPAEAKELLLKGGEFTAEKIQELPSNEILDERINQIKSQEKVQAIKEKDLTKIKDELGKMSQANPLAPKDALKLAQLMNKHELSKEDLKLALKGNQRPNNVNSDEMLDQLIDSSELQNAIIADIGSNSRNSKMLELINNINNPDLSDQKDKNIKQLAKLMSKPGIFSTDKKMGKDDLKMMMDKVEIKMHQADLKAVDKALQDRANKTEDNSTPQWIKYLGVTLGVSIVALGIIGSIALIGSGIALCVNPLTAPLGISLFFAGIVLGVLTGAFGVGAYYYGKTAGEEDTPPNLENNIGNVPGPGPKLEQPRVDGNDDEIDDEDRIRDLSNEKLDFEISKINFKIANIQREKAGNELLENDYFKLEIDSRNIDERLSECNIQLNKLNQEKERRLNQ